MSEEISQKWTVFVFGSKKLNQTLTEFASYGTSFDFIVFLGIFIHNNCQAFMSEVLCLHQTFTDCVSE